MARNLTVSAVVLLIAASAALAAPIPTPEAFLGHPVAADRTLAPWPRVLDYLDAVAAASDRVAIEEAGVSTLGNRMPVVVLTSAGNQARLDEIREINRQLAEGGGSPVEVAGLIEDGRVTALVTCTIHATEVGCTQMAMELVHEVATTEDPEKLAWLDETVLLLMPSINPDGQVLVIDWYERQKGTEYEGGPMPWLYHHYVGHDNNRDFYALTQKESQVVNDVLYRRWFPQVFLDEHQMGQEGPRMFVPPQADPLAPEVHSLVFRQADLLGTNMARRLEEQGKLGVGHDMIFDSYWPGGTRNTAWWKNVTGLLTEVASARIATPVWVDPVELRGGEKGLPKYQRRSNFPSPWPGGWWRLRDIVDYERIATWAFTETLAENRRDVLRNMRRMAAEAIAAGESEAPWAWVVPPDQHDPAAAAALVELLLRHGIRVERAVEPVRVGFTVWPAGTVVIPAGQPYRAFLLTMLRPQRYPEVPGSTGGPIFQPYDVTSWSLPIAMGVEVVEAVEPPQGEREALTEAPWPAPAAGDASGGWTVSRAADSAYPLLNRLLAEKVPVSSMAEPVGELARGDLWIAPGAIEPARLEAMASELHAPLRPLAVTPSGARESVRARRVGIYKPWVASMDEGWTRWLLERYGFPVVNLSNEDFWSGAFRERVDVIVLPDVDPAVIATGMPEDEEERRMTEPLPPRWQGGLDERPAGDAAPAAAERKKKGADEPEATGGERLKRWIEAGGTVVALDSSAGYLIDLLGLPVADVAKDAEPAIVAPGSMLRVLVDTEHPLALGLRDQEAAYFARSPAFQTTVPDGRFTRRVVARYPAEEEDLLVSGYLRGGETLENRAAVVELGVGEGSVVLVGFRAQHRAQTVRTFKLLFNALYALER